MFVDGLEQLTLNRRYPDPDAELEGTTQPLRLIAMMMRHQDICNATHLESIEEIEHRTGPEVYGDRLETVSKKVNITTVVQHKHIRNYFRKLRHRRLLY
jgi:hypothetical protein